MCPSLSLPPCFSFSTSYLKYFSPFPLFILPIFLSPSLPHSLPLAPSPFRPPSLPLSLPPSLPHPPTHPHNSRCQADISNGVNQILQHVNSVKALASIRAAVHSLLADPWEKEGETNGDGDTNVPGSNSWSEQWTEICSGVLGRNLCVWDAFLRPLLLQRAKVRVTT